MSGRSAWASRQGHRGGRGFVLPAVLLILCMLLLLVFTRHFFSRHQYHLVSHLADHERAFQVAAGAVTVGRHLLEQALALVNDGDAGAPARRRQAGGDLAVILGRLTDREGLLHLSEGSVPLTSALFTDLLACHRDGVGLSVVCETRRQGSIYAETATAAIRVDPAEAVWTIRVHAEAKVGAAACRVTHGRELRVVNILPPVVGKFAVFLRTIGGFEVNGVRDTLTAAALQQNPLVVKCGAVHQVESVAPDELGAVLDAQGWVFAGGDVRWRLGIGAGGGSPALADGVFDRRQYVWPLAPREPLAQRGRFAWYANRTPLHRELQDDLTNRALVLANPDDVARSSSLRLTGNTVAPTPTLVLGNVARRYALIQGLKNESTGLYAPLPLLDAGTFAGQQWPGGMSAGTITALRGNFPTGFPGYAVRMSQLVEEPYNAANLDLVRFAVPDADLTAMPVVGTLPGGARAPSGSRRAELDGAPVEPWKLAYGRRFVMRDDGGEVLCRLPDLGGLHDLGFLRAKAGWQVSDGAALLAGLRRIDGGAVLVGGVGLVTGPLDLGRPIRVAPGGGGLILVEGPIRIRAGIETPPGEPLTLVSLGGDITVSTGDPVQAGLVALRGRVGLGDAVHLEGILAARELAMGGGRPGQPRQLTWRPAFDPTDRENYRRAYRVMEDGRGLTYVH